MRATTTSVELSPAQRTAVEWGEGPLMGLAGAGTGKTTVVIERVRYLLETVPALTPEDDQLSTYALTLARRCCDFTAMPGYRTCSWCDFASSVPAGIEPRKVPRGGPSAKGPYSRVAACQLGWHTETGCLGSAA